VENIEQSIVADIGGDIAEQVGMFAEGSKGNGTGATTGTHAADGLNL
jgi:hypothetical protein